IFRGPASKFTLDGAAPQVVMLAQGVGITPLRSMIAHAALSGMTIESSLIHVAHAGHAYRAETEQWATTAAYPQHAAHFSAAPPPRTRPGPTFLMPGATSFVSLTAPLLPEAGVTGANIRQDKSLGYKPAARQEVAGHRSHVRAATAP